MARRDSKIAVDLFPFLSVLCCMIGVLMWYIVGILSTRVIEAEDDVRASAKQTQGIGPNGEEQIDEATYQELMRQADALEETVRDRQQARQELQAKIEQLQALIEAKQDELAAQRLLARRDPIKLDEPDPVRPVPDERFSVGKQPVYVEISAEGYLFQPESRKFPSIEKRAAGSKKPEMMMRGERKADEYVASDELHKFVEEIDKQHERRYLLLLIHPNGVENYHSFRSWLTQSFGVERRESISPIMVRVWREPRLNLGIEPFSRDWQIISTKTDSN